MQCDVRDSAAVDEMVSGAAVTLGGLDVLLHAAGLWRPGIPGQISGDDIDFLVDTNLKATIFTNQAAYAVMRKDGGGRRPGGAARIPASEERSHWHGVKMIVDVTEENQ